MPRLRHVALGEALNVPGPQFPRLQDGFEELIRAHSVGSSWERVCVKEPSA